MQVRGHDLNWFDLMRDAALFHESEFAAGMQTLKEKHGLKSGIGRLDGALLYCLTRWIKPKVIVETGTYCGMSARYMI
jgi:predicted O-methyltransferase YrrM